MGRLIFLFYDVMHTTIRAILTFNIMIHVARIKQKCMRGFWEQFGKRFSGTTISNNISQKNRMAEKS